MAGLGLLFIASMMLLGSLNFKTAIETFDIYFFGRDAVAKVVDGKESNARSVRGRKSTMVRAKLSFDGHEVWTDAANFPERYTYQELRISYLPENPEVLILGHRGDGALSLLYQNLGILRLLFTVGVSIGGGVSMLLTIVFIRDKQIL